jgi:hypothetical protein
MLMWAVLLLLSPLLLAAVFVFGIHIMSPDEIALTKALLVDLGPFAYRGTLSGFLTSAILRYGFLKRDFASLNELAFPLTSFSLYLLLSLEDKFLTNFIIPEVKSRTFPFGWVVIAFHKVTADTGGDPLRGLVYFGQQMVSVPFSGGQNRIAAINTNSSVSYKRFKSVEVPSFERRSILQQSLC